VNCKYDYWVINKNRHHFMKLFSFFSKGLQKPTPLSKAVPQERLWVGTITDLILTILETREWDRTNLVDWTILIDDETNEPRLEGGRPKSGAARRYCSLGDCESFLIVSKSLDVPVVRDMLVQDLAFEICIRAEPRWKEIVGRSQKA
jgi:hypothetical protein